MTRSAFASVLAVIVCSAVASTAYAQAKPAAPTTPAPAARAKFASPIKGEAAIQVIPGTSKFDVKAKEVVTTYKIKNMSNGPIALLKVDEYWYDKGKMVSTDTQRYRQPFQAGEVIEVTTHAPATASPAGWTRNVQFSHANGKVAAKAVKQF